MKAVQGKPHAGSTQVRFGVAALLVSTALVSARVVAGTATYADLGEFSNVDNEFWNTRGHAAVTVSCQSASSSVGFDPRGRISVVAEGEGIDPRGRVCDESAAIGFRSDKPKGLIMEFR